MKITETADAEMREDRGGSVTVAAGSGGAGVGGRTRVPLINKWTRVMPEGHTAWQRETVNEGVSEDRGGGGGG